MEKLLKKALLVENSGHKLRSDSKFTEKEVTELTLAWLTGKITYNAVLRATGKKGGGAYSLLAAALKRAYTRGLISVKQ